jgi:hypothetical protein
MPSAKASASSIDGVTMPVNVAAASAPTATAMASCVPTSSERRSTMSASAPAGRPSAKNGRLSAVSSRDTVSGDGVSDDISQPWATSVMYEPICDAVDAIQSSRKRGCARGLQVDRASLVIAHLARSKPMTSASSFKGEEPAPVRKTLSL